jgi:hypothetical protein
MAGPHVGENVEGNVEGNVGENVEGNVEGMHFSLHIFLRLQNPGQLPIKRKNATPVRRRWRFACRSTSPQLRGFIVEKLSFLVLVGQVGFLSV